MRDVLLALAAGLLCGVVFAAARLPIPAPPTLAGIAGIIGVFLGFLITRRFTGA
ncbi:XapX domain-containing protein [Salinispora arenicola]|uniref:XapX domain-containing protein n=1 Tax=Salinispora arenicola TaxID=168697 RepID=UPI0003701A0A|nr:DUF1427 family protein [Salinispora arenicola]